jgi:drug/metabolite transporter (DMT)-like permease
VVLIVGLETLGGLGRQTAGQLAVLGSAALYAGAAIQGRRFSSLTPTVTAAGTMLWATACLVPLSFILEKPWSLQSSASSIAAAVALGFLCTGIALLIYFRLVRTIGSMGVASQSYLRAGVSVLLGVFVLDERISGVTAVGLLAIIAGVVMINVDRRVPSPARP